MTWWKPERVEPAAFGQMTVSGYTNAARGYDLVVPFGTRTLCTGYAVQPAVTEDVLP